MLRWHSFSARVTLSAGIVGTGDGDVIRSYVRVGASDIAYIKPLKIDIDGQKSLDWSRVNCVTANLSSSEFAEPLIGKLRQKHAL